MPDTLPAFQLAIIARCDEHERQESSKSDFRRCVVFEGHFIKYGSHKSLYPQYRTQQYIANLADGDASAPHVPKVYDYFTVEDKMAYLIMEYIEAQSTLPRDAPEKVAEALQWLRDLPAPSDVTIGPVGGGPARHALFKNYTAPLCFSSIEALERYMNKVCDWIPQKIRPGKVSFSSEQSVFTQSDMDESNFFIDTEGNMCILDFEDVGRLPESFASYTMTSEGKPFVVEVAKYLDWPTSPNIHSMAIISAILKTLGDATLGLDKDGLPRSRFRTPV